MQKIVPFAVGFHHLGEVDTQSEADNGDQVFECAAEISGSQVHAQPGHIAGLTIGKDMISCHIGVGFKESADDCEQDAEQQCFRGVNSRFLIGNRYSLVCFFLSQVCTSYIVFWLARTDKIVSGASNPSDIIA